MKRSLLLTLTSLIAILLATAHLSDDIVRGFEPGGLKNMIGVLMFAAWLYGTLVLAGRRSGYAIMLLGALLGAAMPAVHMMGAGLVGGGRIEGSGGIFFWVWTLIAIQVVSVFSVILAARALWNPDWADGRVLGET